MLCVYYDTSPSFFIFVLLDRHELSSVMCVDAVWLLRDCPRRPLERCPRVSLYEYGVLLDDDGVSLYDDGVWIDMCQEPV
jgi:hypothetical protein